MELINSLLDFFSISSIAESGTFIDLFDWLVRCSFAFALIIIIFSFFFSSAKCIFNASIK